MLMLNKLFRKKKSGVGGLFLISVSVLCFGILFFVVTLSYDSAIKNIIDDVAYLVGNEAAIYCYNNKIDQIISKDSKGNEIRINGRGLVAEYNNILKDTYNIIPSATSKEACQKASYAWIPDECLFYFQPGSIIANGREMTSIPQEIALVERTSIISSDGKTNTWQNIRDQIAAASSGDSNPDGTIIDDTKIPDRPDTDD